MKNSNFYIVYIPLIGILLIVFSCNSKSNNTHHEIKVEDSIIKKYTEAEIYNEVIRKQRVFDKKLWDDTLQIKQIMELSKLSSQTLVNYLKVIYGKDDRYNIYDTILKKAHINDAAKVACLIKKNRIKITTDGTYVLLANKTFAETYQLCSNEKFGKEPIIAYCSGFAVTSTLFVTAGHCVDPNNLTDFLIIYNYKMDSLGNPNLILSKEDVYEPLEIIGHEFNSTLNDYSIIKVKEKFPKDKIAQIRNSGTVPDDEPLHVIGHPSGLPVKITLNSTVQNNSFPNYFTINSDTYQGNSGSPVFNSNSHIVEGILVRGEKDFQYVKLPNCSTSIRCPQNIGSCRGEEVSRPTQFLKLINFN